MKKGKERFLPAGVVTAIFAVALISGFFSAPFAAAQEEKLKLETAQEEKARGEYELGTMTVTAQKQEENVQEVPVSITVFNEQDIEDMKIESVIDLADFIPNLMIYQPGSSGTNVPTTRGISASIESLTVSTGLFVDGVPILNASGFEMEMLNIERIEVLRGPQGTLYGKGAEVGVINIITRQPDNEFRGKVSAEGGQWLSSESGDKLTGAFSLNLNGPIVKDKLFFGIAGRYGQKDGFIENTLTGDAANDRKNWLGKANLRWMPMDKLDISFTASHLEDNDDGTQMNLSEMGAAAFGLPAPQDRKISSNLEGQFYDTKSDLQSLKIDYAISDTLSLTSVSTNSRFKPDGHMDGDFSPVTLMHYRSTYEFSRISEELRLGYSKKRLKWLVGLYYDKDDNDIDRETTSIYPMMAGSSSRNISGDTYAAFANLSYPLTGKLSLITGLRYEKEERDFKDNISHLKMDDSWDGFSPKIAMEYTFTPAIMTYVSAAKGYRSGGFNLEARDPQYFSYDQEELWSYEIGAKSAFLNNRLIINGSVFYMDISDMQVTEALSTGFSFLTNAAEATGKGFELEITARITDGLSLMAGYGYTDIKFDTFSDALGDYKGNKVPWAPKYTFNIGSQYRHVSGFYARADLIGYGKMYFDKSNTSARDAYAIVNAKVGYETNHFDLYLYGKNIFDKEYDSKGVYGGYFDIYSEPGEVGLQLVYRF
jgi:iron complex outermembrane receptor protein